jgi:Domain of unknown function (DUF4265)
MSDADPPRVKVCFSLAKEGDGWPPVSSEGLWAEPLGDDQFKIDNTPWFVLNLATEDVVKAVAGIDGVLWATEKVRWSGHCTIRVIPRRDGPLGGDRQALLDLFVPFGVSGEGIEQYGMVAFDIPAEVDLSTVKAMLKAGEADGRWYFEEGCISDGWASA